MDAIYRQWLIVQEIPREPRKISTAEIRSRLEDEGIKVTLRTIQRDLNSLSSVFPLECDDHKPAGWSWRRAAGVHDLPRIDPSTALAFRMARMFLSPLLPPTILGYLRPHFDMADQVLKTLDISKYATWPGKVASISRFLQLQPPALDPKVTETIYEALFSNRRLTVLYKTRGGKPPRTYEVNPLGLVLADQVVYLVCTFWDYTDIMSLALHRIREASLLEKAATTPKGFTLKGYVDGGAFGYPVSSEKIKLKARFREKTAYHLVETPLGPDQKISSPEDGWVTVEASVLNSAQLRWWLLGFGDQGEVLEPVTLRREIAETVRNLASRYGGTPS